MLTTLSIKNRRMRPFGEFGGLSDADEVHLPRQPCTYNSNSLAKKQAHFAGNFAPFQNGRLRSGGAQPPSNFFEKIENRGLTVVTNYGILLSRQG